MSSVMQPSTTGLRQHEGEPLARSPPRSRARVRRHRQGRQAREREDRARRSGARAARTRPRSRRASSAKPVSIGPVAKPSHTRVDITATARGKFSRETSSGRSEARAGCSNTPRGRRQPDRRVQDGQARAAREGDREQGDRAHELNALGELDQTPALHRVGDGAGDQAQREHRPEADQPDQAELEPRSATGRRRARRPPSRAGSSRCRRGSGSPRTSGTAPRGGPRSAQRSARRPPPPPPWPRIVAERSRYAAAVISDAELCAGVRRLRSAQHLDVRVRARAPLAGP